MKKLAAFAMLAALAGCSSDADPAEDDPMAALEGGAAPKRGTKSGKAVDPDALLADMESAAESQEETSRRAHLAREAEQRRRAEIAKLEQELQAKRARADAEDRARREQETAMSKLQAENRTFEERYASEILNVKRALQKYEH